MISEIAEAAERGNPFRLATSRNNEASSSALSGSMSTRLPEQSIAACRVNLPGYQVDPMTTTRQQVCIVVFSWFVIFAFIAALFTEAVR